MRILFFITFFSLTVTIFGQQKNKESEATSSVLREKYSISYPESWNLDTTKSYAADLILRSPLTDSLDDFSENLNVIVQDLHGQNYYLTKIGRESETQIKNLITDVSIIESKLDSNSSHQYYDLTFKGRQGKFLLTTIQRYYFKDETGYALTFTIKRGKEEEYITVAEKMFDSFRLR
ncbi:MAG: hypothetical protein QM764_19740 [Chitinophagaceae bacterium]